jgi:SNF2 family DNA or RNA helicase
MVRYLKQDVLPQLPDKVRRVIPLEMENPEEYKQAQNNFIAWLKENAPGRITSSFRALTLARTGELVRIAARLKLKGVVDWCNRFLEETEEKLIVFAVHRKCIETLKRRINAESVVVDGSVTGRLRHDTVKEFQRNPNIRVFIGNIHAAGIGINLVQSSTVVFAELWWRPGDHTQAEDRIHRIGQEQQPWIYYFVAAGSIEETLCRIIQKKQEVIRNTLDGRRAVDKMNVHDQLLLELKRSR